jgi:hypothetical protein
MTITDPDDIQPGLTVVVVESTSVPSGLFTVSVSGMKAQLRLNGPLDFENRTRYERRRGEEKTEGRRRDLSGIICCGYCVCDVCVCDLSGITCCGYCVCVWRVRCVRCRTVC